MVVNWNRWLIKFHRVSFGKMKRRWQTFWFAHDWILFGDSIGIAHKWGTNGANLASCTAILHQGHGLKIGGPFQLLWIYQIWIRLCWNCRKTAKNPIGRKFQYQFMGNPTVIDNTAGIPNCIPRSRIPYFINFNVIMLGDGGEVRPVYRVPICVEYFHMFVG